jgi:hypothetical protein
MIIQRRLLGRECCTNGRSVKKSLHIGFETTHTPSGDGPTRQRLLECQPRAKKGLYEDAMILADIWTQKAPMDNVNIAYAIYIL